MPSRRTSRPGLSSCFDSLSDGLGPGILSRTKPFVLWVLSNVLVKRTEIKLKTWPHSSWICLPLALAWHRCSHSLRLEPPGVEAHMAYLNQGQGGETLLEFGAEILWIWKPWTQGPSLPWRTLKILGGRGGSSITWSPSGSISVTNGYLVTPLVSSWLFIFHEKTSTSLSFHSFSLWISHSNFKNIFPFFYYKQLKSTMDHPEPFAA